MWFAFTDVNRALFPLSSGLEQGIVNFKTELLWHLLACGRTEDKLVVLGLYTAVVWPCRDSL